MRCALVLQEGELRWPAPPPNLPVAAAPKKTTAHEVATGPKDLKDETMSSALITTAAIASALNAGFYRGCGWC